MLRDHDRRNFARADEADPFDGMTPEETKLRRRSQQRGAEGLVRSIKVMGLFFELPGHSPAGACQT